MKTYIYRGTTAKQLPDPLKLEDGSSISPMTEALFLELGGTIADDGEPSPREAVVASLNALLRELAEEVDGITVAEFRQAARTMHSGELIAYARQRGVSEEIITAARARFVEIMADALREGLTWTDLIEGSIAAGRNDH